MSYNAGYLKVGTSPWGTDSWDYLSPERAADLNRQATSDSSSSSSAQPWFHNDKITQAQNGNGGGPAPSQMQQYPGY